MTDPNPTIEDRMKLPKDDAKMKWIVVVKWHDGTLSIIRADGDENGPGEKKLFWQIDLEGDPGGCEMLISKSRSGMHVCQHEGQWCCMDANDCPVPMVPFLFDKDIDMYAD